MKENTYIIYQSKKGSIEILINNRNTALSLNQINALGIDVYSLEDFNHDDFKSYYKII